MVNEWPQLHGLLVIYSCVFDEGMILPLYREYDHKTELKEETNAVNIRPYRYAGLQKDEIEKMTREMLEVRVVRPSKSPFASPMVLVKRKDGTWRMCIDYRALNQATVKNKFLIPVIEQLLEELGGAKVFSKINLRSRYWQIRMNPEDVYKIAFRTHEGHYDFVVMSFGLTNAPSTFSTSNELYIHAVLKRVFVAHRLLQMVCSQLWKNS